MKRPSVIVIAVLGAVLCALLIARLVRQSSPEAKPGAPDKPAELSPTRFAIATDGDPSLGPTDALVTIVELGDFQCTSTRDAAPLVRRVLAEHPQDVRLVWKDAPMSVHRHAVPAARLAGAIHARSGEDAFWKAHDQLLKSADKLDSARLLELAGSFGIDGGEAVRILSSADVTLESDLSLARALRAHSTPRLFVNGRPLQGGVSYESLSALVNEELLAARQLVEKGVTRVQVPAQLVARAEVPREPPGAPPRIEKEKRRAQEQRKQLIEAMGRSEAFHIDDATLAELTERGFTREQVYEYVMQRSRVRLQLGPEAALAPAAKPK